MDCKLHGDRERVLLTSMFRVYPGLHSTRICGMNEGVIRMIVMESCNLPTLPTLFFTLCLESYTLRMGHLKRRELVLNMAVVTAPFKYCNLPTFTSMSPISFAYFFFKFFYNTFLLTCNLSVVCYLFFYSPNWTVNSTRSGFLPVSFPAVSRWPRTELGTY